MRPTLGSVPSAGILPSARSQETAAPVGRSVSRRRDARWTGALRRRTPRSASPRSSGKRIGVIAPTGGNAQQRFTEAQEVIEGLGATAVPLTAPNRPSTAKIVDREFKRDLDAYLAPYGKSTAGIVAFNDAHPADTLKFGQARLRAAAAINLDDPATRRPTRPTWPPGARHRARGSTACSRRRRDPLADREHGRGRHPRRLPAGHGADGLRPDDPPPGRALVHRQGGRRREAARLRLRLRARGADPPHAVGDQPADVALRRARGLPHAHVRAGRAAPDVTDSVSVPAPVGGTVPATLALTLGAPASFGAFTPGSRGSTRRRRPPT